MLSRARTLKCTDGIVIGSRLGIFADLWQLKMAWQEGLDYLYLGYVICYCAKIAYKTKYRPLELYLNGRLVELL